MKEVVTSSITVERIFAESCKSYNLYYGAIRNASDKGIVVRTRYHSLAGVVPDFQLRSFSEFTNGNFWNVEEGPCLETFLHNLVNDGWTVMQFDTMKELVAWLEV